MYETGKSSLCVYELYHPVQGTTLKYILKGRILNDRLVERSLWLDGFRVAEFTVNFEEIDTRWPMTDIVNRLGVGGGGGRMSIPIRLNTAWVRKIVFTPGWG